MRVIGGKYKGRLITSPKTVTTHPMSEKLRGAIFATLGDIDGLSVLDAYAGSGAIAFEALSRGAKNVLAIEPDRLAAVAIKTNADRLKPKSQEFKTVQASIEGWLNTSTDQFDLIIADPPYDQVKDRVLLRLAERLKPDGLLVVSLPVRHDVIWLNRDLQILKVKQYGDAQLLFTKSRPA